MRSKRIFAVFPVFELLLALGLAGCSGVEPVPIAEPSNDPALFAWLVMAHHAVTISTVAPYDTVTLVATPLDLTGKPIPNLPAPTFTVPVSDTAFLQVTPEGLVQARQTGRRLHVIASLSLPGNISHSDTTVVDITDLSPPPRLMSISMHPTDGDSATRGLPAISSLGSDIASQFQNQSFFYADFILVAVALPPVLGPHVATAPILALDSAGNSLDELLVEVTELDPEVGVAGYLEVIDHSVLRSVLNLDYKVTRTGSRGSLQPVAVGPARLVVQTKAYGITMADTVTWHATWPAYQPIHFIPRLDGTPAIIPDTTRIRSYGIVSWLNWTADTVSMAFDDPTNVALPSDNICQVFTNFASAYDPGPHCGTGDVIMPARLPPPGGFPPSPLGGDTLTFIEQAYYYDQVRQFPVPGTYRFRETRTGATGVVIVTDEPDGTAP